MRTAGGQVADADGKGAVEVGPGPAADNARVGLGRAEIDGEIKGTLKGFLEIDPVTIRSAELIILHDVAVALDREGPRLVVDRRVALEEQAVGFLEVVIGLDQDVAQLQVVGAVGQIEGHAAPGVVEGGRVADHDAVAVRDLDASTLGALAVGDEAVDDGVAHAVQIQFGATRSAYGDIVDRKAVQHSRAATPWTDLDAIGRTGVGCRSGQGEVGQLHAARPHVDAVAGYAGGVDEGGVTPRTGQRDRAVDD